MDAGRWPDRVPDGAVPAAEDVHHVEIAGSTSRLGRVTDPRALVIPAATAAIQAVLGDGFRDEDPVIRPSQFADVQINAALALAKRAKRPPREVADAIAEALDLDGLAAGIEVSGPGFINITFDDDAIGRLATELLTDARVGIPLQERRTIPIDYSAPNVAKEMHVAHLRTTVVGDALARTLEALGHDVIRQNHIGDWGTNFGMLIERLVEVGPDSEEAAAVETDPNAFYQAAYARFQEDTAFADRARARVVDLQAGEPEAHRLWERLFERSRVYFNRIYSTLNVTLTDEHLAGESTYNDRLEGICHELEERGIAVESDGALCVFPDGFTGRDGEPLPLIIRKSDGGYGYATTDLATIRHRIQTLGADRVLYVVGATQALHLQMVFATARLAGWLPDDVEVVHVQIGTVLGEDHKMLKTRSGNPLRLMALLDEAVTRAREVIDDARPDLDEETRARIAPAVGIGAVKYADLSVAHDSEYVFDLDRMVRFSGNTGPYMQYAAARIRSIFRNADRDPGTQRDPIRITETAERDLALRLLEFGSVVAGVGEDLAPHRLCAHLFDVAQAFSTFYESCPILKAPDDATRESRLSLAAATLHVVTTGLDLLGVDTPERM